jgi:hypothetical protein
MEKAMTEPVTAGLFVASTALQAFGQHKQISAQNQANDYNAQVLRNNAALGEQSALIEEQKASQAREAGRVQEKGFRERAERLKGTQRAGFAASGVVVDEGSALAVAEDTAELTELDALNIRHNAELQAFDYEMNAYNERIGSGKDLEKANLLESRKRSSFLPVAGTLLSGASTFGNKYGNPFSKNKGIG